MKHRKGRNVKHQKEGRDSDWVLCFHTTKLSTHAVMYRTVLDLHFVVFEHK